MSDRSFDDDAPGLDPAIIARETAEGIDRRSFMMRSAMIGAVAVLAGTPPVSAKEAADRAASGPPAVPDVKLSPDLDVVKRSKGPVMTVLEEFYKVGPGPSSSHTIGPMRITYDFYQRCTKLPADQLAKATALRVHLYGSLSATGKASAPS
jgi:L-serine dehydratase